MLYRSTTDARSQQPFGGVLERRGGIIREAGPLTILEHGGAIQLDHSLVGVLIFLHITHGDGLQELQQAETLSLTQRQKPRKARPRAGDVGVNGRIRAGQVLWFSRSRQVDCAGGVCVCIGKEPNYRALIILRGTSGREQEERETGGLAEAGDEGGGSRQCSPEDAE